MEIYNAEVIEIETDRFLQLKMNGENYNIPLTKDEPNVVKSIFNNLIVHLKNGVFKFVINDDDNGDIIYHVAKEYISSLNSELLVTYKELKEHNLIN